MSTSIKPNHDAQMRNMPLSVSTGSGGFRIAHIAGDLFWPIHAPTLSGQTIYFGSPEEAYAVMREARGATAAMLATVFGRVA